MKKRIRIFDPPEQPMVTKNDFSAPASKQYDATDLKTTIQVDNDAKYDFPPLKSITPE
jgi:hypothetical protein